MDFLTPRHEWHERGPKRVFGSMFVRRLLLVGVAIGAGLVVLAGQTFWLTAVRGGEMLEVAERRMLSERWTPTTRGKIRDRKGRVLAEDRPAFDVMVSYEVITGDWAYNTAADAARREHRDAWAEMDRAARERLIGGYLEGTSLEQDRMWRELAAALGIGAGELDERRRQITAHVERMANSIWDARLEKRRAELSRDRELSVEVTREEVAQPIREQRMAHVVATGVDEDTAFQVRRLAERYEGVALEPGGRRDYPYERVPVVLDRTTFPEALRAEGSESILVEGVATHILGWMRPIYAEDVAARPRIDPETGEVDRGHYRTGDRAGRGGVEASYERTLRGLRGYVVKHRDTGVEEVVAARAGEDVTLTIDVELQARIQAAMTPEVGLAQFQDFHVSELSAAPAGGFGSPINGSAVVLDIDTGEILAMVSMPTFTREQVETETEWVFGDPVDFPYVNRPIAMPYMPGSPVKPIVLASAVSAGLHRLSHPIECTGHLIPGNPSNFRCWIFQAPWHSTHQAQFERPLTGDDAICVSCNIYFYTLGELLGVDGCQDWFGRFGVGRGFGLGLGPEYPGIVGEKMNGEPVYRGEARLMGIGQGPILWTPLHAADAYATLVRGGQRIVPRIVKGETIVAEELLLDPEAVNVALRGLRRALHDPMGSGHGKIDVPGVSTWGKTGTAESARIFGEDEDGDGKRDVLREGDHAWFVLLVGREGGMPRYAVSVVMEYAGSGGKVSGPIAEQIVWALRAEGYL